MLASETTTEEYHDELVPHLVAAFELNSLCQINLDPIVVAVACFLRHHKCDLDKRVTTTELVEKGSDWFPQRKVHSYKQEADRMARFAKSYPNVFIFEGDAITLQPGALCTGEPHPNDEAWYTIALHRLAIHDAKEVNEALDDIENVQRAYLWLKKKTPPDSRDHGVQPLGTSDTTASTVEPTEIQAISAALEATIL